MVRKATISLFLVPMLLLAACGGGGSGPVSPPSPPPVEYNYSPPLNTGDSWVVGDAGDNGLNVSIIEDMMNDIGAGQFGFVDSISIVKNGVLVFEETIRTTTDEDDGYVGNNDVSVHRQYSASKSVMSLVVGIAIDEGYIAGVGMPYLNLFPYPTYANWDPRKDDMTLEHALSMRLGLDWDEWDPPYTSPQNQLINFYDANVDYSKGLLDLAMSDEPGSVFAYNTIATVTLGQAVENVAPMSFVDYMNNKLLLPLGITDFEYLVTPTGLPNSGSGFYLRTRDMAKIGQLALGNGLWNGQRIVSEAWLIASMTPLTKNAWTDPAQWDWQIDGYGYQWWTGFYDFNGVVYPTYVAWGYGGQWVVVIPDLDMVVAANSHAYGGNDAGINEAHALIRGYVLPATDQ